MTSSDQIIGLNIIVYSSYLRTQSENELEILKRMFSIKGKVDSETLEEFIVHLKTIDSKVARTLKDYLSFIKIFFFKSRLWALQIQSILEQFFYKFYDIKDFPISENHKKEIISYFETILEKKYKEPFIPVDFDNFSFARLVPRDLVHETI
jgi:hypothetical protein